LESLAPIIVLYQCYQYQLSHPLPEVHTAEGFVIQEVTPDLVASTLEGKEDLLEEMCSERETVEAFLENSFGIVAFQEQTLAGWCLSEYNHNGQCEIGIATMPPFQKQGLAKATTYAFIKLAEGVGINKILWHCFKSNQASQRTAMKSGFELLHEELVLMVYLDRAVNAAVHGNLHFKAESYHEALTWYEKALTKKQPQPWMAWNAACAAAHCNQINLAFDFLEQAIELGFTDLDYFVQSSHMTPLKEDKRWDEIITKMNSAIHS
jgi:GNAT superfamily N-acetyltransferase